MIEPTNLCSRACPTCPTGTGKIKPLPQLALADVDRLLGGLVRRLHELPEMRRLARGWGVDALRIKTVGADDEATRGLVPASSLLSRYAADGETPSVRHAFCTMAWDHTVINVDGSVTPCCYLRPDMGPEFVMGNALEAPFAEIWRGEKYRAFRAQMLTDRSAMPVCGTC